MEWLNVHIPTFLKSPAYILSDPAGRGTWLSVLGYCCQQENGGVVADCSEWKTRTWEQLCGVTREEIDAAGHLLKWRGDSLEVVFYPMEKEEAVRIKRASGHDGAAKRWGKVGTPISTPNGSANTEGKENGKEREEKENGKPERAVAHVKMFVPPALEEVKTYCFERRNTVDAAKWHAYYSSNGWKVGKNPMKDWKAAVRTWEADGKGPGTLNVPRAKPAKLDGAKKAEIARVLCEGCTVDEFLDKTALIQQALAEAGSVLMDMDEQDVRIAGVEMIKEKGKI